MGFGFWDYVFLAVLGFLFFGRYVGMAIRAFVALRSRRASQAAREAAFLRAQRDSL